MHGFSSAGSEMFLPKILLLCVALAMLAFMGLARKASANGPYRVLKTVKVGGVGTFDTACADIEGRKLYIPRKKPGRITVFNLDTLEPFGEIPDAAANGVVVDVKSGHGFASSKPVAMWDTKTLKTIKTIDVQGGRTPSCSTHSTKGLHFQSRRAQRDGDQRGGWLRGGHHRSRRDAGTGR